MKLSPLVRRVRRTCSWCLGASFWTIVSVATRHAWVVLLLLYQLMQNLDIFQIETRQFF